MIEHTSMSLSNPSLVALNMIRMIKLFGWEGKMKEQIDEKRNEELVYVRKLKFMQMANEVIK